MGINLIVAVASNGVIGHNGKIPWSIPGELAYFKKVTTGHIVVMGRKTFESIGKPLPDRTNYILTHNSNYEVKDVFIYNNIQDVLHDAESQDIFIIGGSQIYRAFMPHADKIYLTRIHQDFYGDTYFEMDDSWKLVSSEEGPSEFIPHTFEVYERPKDGLKDYPHKITLNGDFSNTEVGVTITLSRPNIEAVVYYIDKDQKIYAVITSSYDSRYKSGHHVVFLHTKEHIEQHDLEHYKNQLDYLDKDVFPQGMPLHSIFLILQMLVDKGVLTEDDIMLIKKYYDTVDKRWY